MIEVAAIITSLTPYALGVIVGYLVYNHKRHDKTEKDVIVLQTKMDSIKEDITEIRKMLEKLIDRRDGR